MRYYVENNVASNYIELLIMVDGFLQNFNAAAWLYEHECNGYCHFGPSNSLWLNDAICSYRTLSPLVQVIVCRLSGAMLLHETMLTYCQLPATPTPTAGTYFSAISINLIIFPSRKVAEIRVNLTLNRKIHRNAGNGIRHEKTTTYNKITYIRTKKLTGHNWITENPYKLRWYLCTYV